jgi:peptide/nickel transport system permease protein
MRTVAPAPGEFVFACPRGLLGRIRPGVAAASLALLYFVIAVIAPSVLTSHGPNEINLQDTLQSPSIHHVFGTDPSGRDLYSRVVWGARQALLIGVGATVLAMAVGIMLGTLSGIAGGIVDAAINRFVEVLFAFPVLILALLLVSIFGPSATTTLLAVAIGSAPGYTRMIRGQVLAVRGSGYVEAAHALGHPYPQIVRRHVFPNAMRPLVVVLTLGMGQSIVWASGLSFLGLGVAPPSSEWGALLDAGRDWITQAWWLEVMPGVAIVAFALSVTTIGRFVQQQLEGGISR